MVDGQTTLSRSSSSEDFPSFKTKIGIGNFITGSEDGTFDVGLLLCKGNELLSLLDSKSSNLSLTLVVRGIDNDGVAKFTANSKEISSDPCERRPITFKLNLTDLNKESNSPIYLWGNEDPEKTVLLAGKGSNLDPGETGDVEIHYTPQRSGDFTFYISGSATDYTESLVETFEVNVNSSEAYQDPVRIWLLKENPSTGEFNSVTRVVRSADIPVGETAEVPFEFYDLKTDVNYALVVQMYENTDWKFVNFVNGRIPQSAIFMLVDATGIQSIQSDAPDAEVYNLNGVFMGKASDLKSLPKGLYIINKKKVVNN